MKLGRPLPKEIFHVQPRVFASQKRQLLPDEAARSRRPAPIPNPLAFTRPGCSSLGRSRRSTFSCSLGSTPGTVVGDRCCDTFAFYRKIYLNLRVFRRVADRILPTRLLNILGQPVFRVATNANTAGKA